MNNNNNEQYTRPPPKYQVGDIVVVGRVRRHIYNSPSWRVSSTPNSSGEWLYPVDYGLGLTKEAYHLETEMRPCLEGDINKPL